MIQKMKLVNIVAHEDQLNELLTKFIDFEGFHPVESTKFIDTVHGLRGFEHANPGQELLNEIKEIEQDFAISLPEVPVTTIVDDIDQMHQTIVESHRLFKNEVDKIRDLENRNHAYGISLIYLKNIEKLDNSLDDFFNAKFISVRFGKLPHESVERLKYYRHKPFIFMPLEEGNTFTWCMYMMTNESERDIDNIMASLFFERIHIPAYVHGTPKEARVKLEELIKENETEIRALKANLTTLSTSLGDRLCFIKSELQILSKIFDAKQYVVVYNDKVSISGFVEKKKVKTLRNHFSGVLGLEIDVRPALSDHRLKPPTKLKNNWFTRPFEMFVQMYGIPGYEDIDPTFFVAITYSILFGIMFGDLGQGLLLSLLGFLLYKFKKLRLGEILVRIGFSSAIFGVVYGSFFGNEEIIPDVFHQLGLTWFQPIHPMSNEWTMNLLISTVVIGAFIIMTAISVNIVLHFKRKKYVEGILSHNGVFGLLFYGSILVGFALESGLLGVSINFFNPLVIVLLILIPIIGIFFKEPIAHLFERKKVFPEGIFGFFIQGFFELFEVVLSYVTNTMSFLRVGGFILSHAGMMLVVHTIMNMTNNPSMAIIVSVIGNLFVMGLEGLIVGIQVLRLEFYEMFSRYFEGNGIEFSPIS